MNPLMMTGNLTGTDRVQSGDSRLTRAEAERTANQFEALFINLLMSRMKNSMNEGGFFGEAAGSQVQEGMFTSMLAEQVCTKGPGLGIAEQLVQDWARSGHIRDDKPLANSTYGKDTSNV